MLGERVTLPETDADGYFAVDATGTRLRLRLEPGEALVGATLIFELPEAGLSSISSLDRPDQYQEQRDDQGVLEWLSLDFGYTARVKGLLLQDVAGPGPAGSARVKPPGALMIHQGGPWYPPSAAAELRFDQPLALPTLQAAAVQVSWVDRELKPTITEPELVVELETRPSGLRILVDGAAAKELREDTAGRLVCELGPEDVPDFAREGEGGELQLTLLADEHPGLLQLNLGASQVSLESQVHDFVDENQQALGDSAELELELGQPHALDIGLSLSDTSIGTELVALKLALSSELSELELHPDAAGPASDAVQGRTSLHLSPQHRLAQRFVPPTDVAETNLAMDVFLRPLSEKLELKARLLADLGGVPDASRVLAESESLVLEGSATGPWPGAWQRFSLALEASEETLWLELSCGEGEALWYLSSTEAPEPAAEFSLGSYTPQPERGLSLRVYQQVEVPVWPSIQLELGGQQLAIDWPADGHLQLGEDELATLRVSDQSPPSTARLVLDSQLSRQVRVSDLAATLRHQM